jgi:hypothetical protein
MQAADLTGADVHGDSICFVFSGYYRRIPINTPRILLRVRRGPSNNQFPVQDSGFSSSHFFAAARLVKTRPSTPRLRATSSPNRPGSN